MMTMMVRAFAVLVALAAGAMPAVAETAFAPGQVWGLQGAGYESVRVIVGKTESVGGKPAVHVSLTGVAVHDDLGAPIGTMPVGHLPFAEEALRHSVSQLIAE